MATIPEAFAIAVQHHQAGRLPHAKQIYQQILAVQPKHADALHLLGVIASQSGQFQLAIETIEQAIALNGGEAAYHNNLGNALKGARKFDKAIGSYRRALELKPDLADAYYNLGNSLTQLRRFDEAIASFQSALKLRPNWAEAHCNLGNVLEDHGNLAEAIVCYRRAIELKDNFVDAHNNLGTAYKLQGMLDESIACYRRALEINPSYAGAHSNLLYTSQYHVNATLSQLAESHAEYDRVHAIPLRNQWRPHENDRDPNRRLRIGFLSPDLGRHPVGQFLIRGFEKLDRNQCETICYSDRLKKDDVTKRFQEASSIWREVIGLSDKEVAERIAADRIDILIDLAGHTANNRLLVFARKPAPIQITWIGYEGTTGLSAMDYILADEATIPLGSERFYQERVLRMPRGYVCYDPPQGSPEASPLPAQKNGFVRFGSFNNPAKITPETIQVWANVLERVPQSKLLLKYRGLGDGTVIKRYLDRFTALGVPEAQLEF